MCYLLFVVFLFVIIIVIHCNGPFFIYYQTEKKDFRKKMRAKNRKEKWSGLFLFSSLKLVSFSLICFVILSKVCLLALLHSMTTFLPFLFPFSFLYSGIISGVHSLCLLIFAIHGGNETKKQCGGPQGTISHGICWHCSWVLLI